MITVTGEDMMSSGSSLDAAGVAKALADRCRAVVEGNADHLESILLPEFQHIHATGKVEPRPVYLDSIRSGRARFSAVEPGEVTIDAYGGAAVVAGDIRIERLVEGTPTGRTSRFVSVWRETGGEWRLAFWQMTAIKDP